ncbi:MAG: sensor histidine kinase [Flavobacteriaceae bacterium]
MTITKRTISLRTRIFFSMIVLTVFSLLLILIASYFQYHAQSDDYNTKRLIRKETQVKNHLNYLMRRDAAFEKIAAEKARYQQEFFSISTIHKVEYALFTLEGTPLFYSYVQNEDPSDPYQLSQEIITQLFQEKGMRIGLQNDVEKGKFQSSYSVLSDDEDRPYVILYFPYFEDISFSTNELNTFLTRFYQISLFMMIITFSFAFLLSSFITRPIETLRKKIDQTALLKGNERIFLDNASTEINTLVASYNSMLDALEKSAEKLAKSEREQAWQEMAKQVAHEIKNPLTPMRLTIQSFQQRFDPNDAKSLEKLNDFSKILIEQIDTMSDVASAFSDFATLPQPKITKENIVEITRLATEIFEGSNIEFNVDNKEIIWPIDRTQWIRVMTNLLQNAIQSVPQGRTPKIELDIAATSQQIEVKIKDNGSGISPEDFNKVFEPKFTTKTGGMGLGLAIVKNIINSLNGSVSFESSELEGTIFTIKLNRPAHVL